MIYSKVMGRLKQKGYFLRIKTIIVLQHKINIQKH